MRRAPLASLALAALLTLLVGAGGCARVESSTPAEDGAATAVTRPRPELDAQLPTELQTAVFGLG